jgi:valyl-tRNA synthetase
VVGRFVDEVRRLAGGLVALARLGEVDVVDALRPASGEARTLTAAGIEAAVPLAEVVDLGAERARLSKRLEGASADIARAERKLGNPEFTSKAPPEVVDREKAKLDEARSAAAKLQAQLQVLADA